MSPSPSNLSPIPLIRTADEITPEWATAVLQANGDLGPDDSITAVDVVSFGDAAGLLGELQRVHLTASDGADAPATFVVKFPISDPAQRGVADALGFYKREVTFYNEHTADLPFGTARCFGAVQVDQSAESTDFVLVMEDLGGLDQIDQVAGAPLDQTRCTVFVRVWGAWLC